VTTSLRLRWTGSGDRFEPADAPDPIWVVDSWLVADGRVRAFDAHVRRFRSACAELSSGVDGLARDFMAAVAARLPAEGYWFPRAEFALVAGVPRFQLWIRPAPALGAAVRLWLTEVPDTRTRPRIKGPDLDWLAEQRADAMAAGADEAVLLSLDGRLLEGSTTSIVWWSEGRLCAPSEEAAVLPGITRSLLLDAAAADGVPVAFGRPRPAELSGLEVWAVNALHGIRPVHGWVGADIAAGSAHRAARWQRRLNELAVPIGTGQGKGLANVSSAAGGSRS
jgi:branched-subunit amino acid aminotransferase/4-amino-4-deoxychorismate lyase